MSRLSGSRHPRAVAVSNNLSLTERSDLRETLFNALMDQNPSCYLTFAQDIEPWLGNQIGGFIPAGNGTEYVVVLEAESEAPALSAVRELGDCGVLPDGSAVYNDGYVLVGSDAGAAEAAVAEASTRSLEDHPDYQEDRAELGTSGVGLAWTQSVPVQYLYTQLHPLESRSAAAVLRFNEGNLELNMVSKVTGDLPDPKVTKMGDLPASTAFAMGVAGGSDYVPLYQDLVTQMGLDSSTGSSNFRFPQDFETLLGDDFVIAGDRFDPSDINFSRLDSLSDLPVGLRIATDPVPLRALADRLNTTRIRHTHLENGDINFVSLNAGYAHKLQSPADRLGDQDGYKAAVAEPDKAQAVTYVDISAYTAYLQDDLDESSGFGPRDLHALQAFGSSVWSGGDNYLHGTSRLTAR